MIPGVRMAVAAAAAALAMGFLALRLLPPVRCDVTMGLLARCDWQHFFQENMKRELRAIQELQEAYWDEYWSYASWPPDLNYVPSPLGGAIITSGTHGWSATAGANYGRCGIYWGEGPPPPTFMQDRGVAPGEIYCTLE